MRKKLKKPKETPAQVLEQLKAHDQRKGIIDAHEAVAKAEVSFIFHVLEGFLGREPDGGDFEKCSRYFVPKCEPGEYGLLYEKSYLGLIKLKETGGEIWIEFEPNTGKCQKCAMPGLGLHSCPYKSDVDGDIVTKCNCCYQCHENCMAEI